MSVNDALNQHRYKIISTLRHTLFHYTSLDAMNGILRYKKLWLTKSEFLNDISEIQYSKQLAIEVRKRAKEKYKDDAIFLEVLNESNDMVFGQGVDVFILSMSLNNDSLPLWSNYSNNEGYCIGFNSNFIEKLDKHDLLNIHGEVIYDANKQLEILSDEISIAYEIWKKHGDNEYGSDLNLIWNHIIRTLYIYSLFFKDPCFSSEEEYRVAFLLNVKKEFAGKFISSDRCTYDHVKFRPKSGAIIPYIEVPVAFDDEMVPLKSISIGPGIISTSLNQDCGTT